MVKFDDLQEGPTPYTYSDFSEDGVLWTIRSPNVDLDQIIQSHRDYRNVPFIVRRKIGDDHNAPLSFTIKFQDGKYREIFRRGYGATDFKVVSLPKEVLAQIEQAPAKKIKDSAMGELRAMPGAVDYEKVAATWPGKPGGKRHTRKRRGKKRVRGTSKRTR